MEAETGVMQPQAKECVESPEARGGKEKISAQSLQRERGPANTLISLVLSHSVCGNLL